MVYKITVENFVRIVCSFCKNRKRRKMAVFCHFWVNLAMFLTSQSYDFIAFAHAGASLCVE